MKNCKAIFFDWDGTAVLSRKAPANEAVKAMRPLLDEEIPLCIVSGTSYGNIAGGKLHELFTQKQLNSLFLGLGRGAFNYRFANGMPELFSSRVPDARELISIHRACFELHCTLLSDYALPTDIVFSRPNYCKLDLMAEHDRGDMLFLQSSEIDKLRALLREHGIEGGAGALIKMAEQAGARCGIKFCATTDAKYLEAGPTGKADNVNALLTLLSEQYGISAVECCFWGDEFIELDNGVFGSDSGMITALSSCAEFFDVSGAEGKRPERVTRVGGGVEAFLAFLRERAGGE